MPPAARAPGNEEGLPSEDEDDEAPLLDQKQSKSDAPSAAAPPMSPRDKLREKGKKTPMTPRSAARQLEEQGKAALEDPAAAADAAKAALADSDPAAAQLIAEAEAMAQKLKEDPKAAAMDAANAALEAAKSFKPPTAEELAATRDAIQKEALATAEAGKRLWDEIINDVPPPCFPFAAVSARMVKYIDASIAAIPEGKLPPSLPPEKLKEYILLAIQVLTAVSGWVAFIVRWIVRIWNM